MKKKNLFAMGLLVAATSFTACSDNVTENGGQEESKADGFYMTLTVQTPTSNSTRTSTEDEKSTKYGTTNESDVTTGTLYLVDKYGNIAYSQTFATDDWDKYGENTGQPTQNGTEQTNHIGTKTIKLEVKMVTAGEKYNVYFLANSPQGYTAQKPWRVDVASTQTFTKTDETLAAAQKFSYPFSIDKSFTMFNQNDSKQSANAYTVQFKDENKNDKTPAYVINGEDKTPIRSQSDAIKLDRLVARIDQPTSKASKIVDYPSENGFEATESYKEQMKDAASKVKSIALTKYALSNMPSSSYIMQQWDNQTTPELVIPAQVVTTTTEGSSTTTNNYQQNYASFGTTTQADGLDQFVSMPTEEGTTLNNYVLENLPAEQSATTDLTVETVRDRMRTAMYFEYKVTLNNTYTDGDIKAGEEGSKEWDGTFYRYNGKIYTKLSEIYDEYSQIAGWAGFKKLEKNNETNKYSESTGTYETTTEGSTTFDNYAVTVLEDCMKDEDNLSTLRKAWGIEVFRQGLCYYKQMIKDANYGNYAVHRNTIYSLTVNNIYNIGADVPNGNPTENDAMYYLNIAVAVNPWVLSSQVVDFH